MTGRVAPCGSGGFDAVILAGGRASRLGGIDKPALHAGGGTLLVEAIRAAEGAERTVVVGPEREYGEPAPRRASLLFTREDPAFGGPAAALGAGLDALGSDAAPWILLLAADQPNVRAAVVRLREAPIGADGALAMDPAGRRQYLLGRYRTDALRRRIASITADGSLSHAPLRRIIDGLDLHAVVLTDELCSDVDTEEDARRLGIRLPADTTGHGSRHGH